MQNLSLVKLHACKHMKKEWHGTILAGIKSMSYSCNEVFLFEKVYQCELTFSSSIYSFHKWITKELQKKLPY